MRNIILGEGSGFGCSMKLLLVVLLITMLMGTVYQFFRFLSAAPPMEYIPTSTVAAQRCREKLSNFNNNEYITKITLSEIEINSAIQESFKDEPNPLTYPWIKLKDDQFILEKLWDIVNLGTPKQEISSLGLKSEGKSFWHWRVRLKITGNLELSPGLLTIVPHQIRVGKINLPGFLISFFQRTRPGLFNYSIASQIGKIHLRDSEIELTKQGYLEK